MVFCSSRTLPGQSYSMSPERNSGAMLRSASGDILLRRSRKCPAHRPMSPGRSLRGGISSLSTLRRK